MDGLEWNVRVSAIDAPRILHKFEAMFGTYWEDTEFETYRALEADRLRFDNPNRDWYLQNLKMIEALRDPGYDLNVAIGAGAHADSHGGAILPDVMRWLWRDFPK